MNSFSRTLAAALLLAGVACTSASPPSDAAHDSPTATAAPSDSQYTAAAMASAFRAKLGGAPVTALGAGATDDRAALIAGYARALASRDTAAFRAMQLDVREFAWLYYEDSPMAQPPYELDPDVMWMQISAQSQRGLTRALDRFGGTTLGATRTACDAPTTHGAMRMHACTLTWRPDGASDDFTMPLSIVERDGRFKFVGYGNPL